jgi:hypothetical protein
MKYRVKYIDSSWLFFTPFAFLNMGGTEHWVVQSKKHWWNKWKKVETYSNKKDAYKKLNQLNYERINNRTKSNSL